MLLHCLWGILILRWTRVLWLQKTKYSYRDPIFDAVPWQEPPPYPRYTKPLPIFHSNPSFSQSIIPLTDWRESTPWLLVESIKMLRASYERNTTWSFLPTKKCGAWHAFKAEPAHEKSKLKSKFPCQNKTKPGRWCLKTQPKTVLWHHMCSHANVHQHMYVHAHTCVAQKSNQASNWKPFQVPSLTWLF